MGPYSLLATCCDNGLQIGSPFWYHLPAKHGLAPAMPCPPQHPEGAGGTPGARQRPQDGVRSHLGQQGQGNGRGLLSVFSRVLKGPGNEIRTRSRPQSESKQKVPRASKTGPLLRPPAILVDGRLPGTEMLGSLSGTSSKFLGEVAPCGRPICMGGSTHAVALHSSLWLP